MPGMDTDIPIGARVVAAFGGITKTARALGLSTSTVQGWKESGRIMYWRHAAIVDAAARHGVTLPAGFPPQASAAEQPPDPAAEPEGRAA